MTTADTAPRDAFDALGDEDFVLLTTFRKSGVGVDTPVWVARDGDALLVITPDDTGKVKRLRNNMRVQLQPSTRFGKPSNDSAPVEAVAEVLRSTETAGYTGYFRTKYGFQFAVTMFIERVLAKRQKPRVILRIVRSR
jgi:PPOX class probable F420-dependent enzyme